MGWIQNISFADILKGWHYDAGPNSMLIQIVDPDMEFPKPLYPFSEIHQYKFLDLEEEYIHAIQFAQAASIARNLEKAKEQKSNVIVHCVAGMCRSGAVAEAGISIGFLDTQTPRSPNMRVKQMLMTILHNF